jgi:hypothetical protein
MKRLLILISVLLLIAVPQIAIADSSIEIVKSEPVKVYRVEGRFEDLKEALVFSIESHGLVLSYVAQASEMFARTAKATGNNSAVYQKAENLFFCKAKLSHELVREDPHSVVFCPFVIAIYTLNPSNIPQTKGTIQNDKTNKDKGSVFLAYPRLPKELETSKPIEALLESIIKETIEF